MNILIVDDEPAISDTLAYTLRADGFAVDSCTLGGAALARLAAGGIDLVVLDVGLPDMTGFDVCRALRRTSDVPVLFLAARSDEVDRIVGLELGGDDYVPKPFSPREVASRIRAILRRLHPEPRLPSAAEAPAPSRFAIDRDGLRVAFHGTSIACAKCHNHPMEKWTNNEYFAFANMLSRVRTKNGAQADERVLFSAADGELVQPLTGKPQPPHPLN